MQKKRKKIKLTGQQLLNAFRNEQAKFDVNKKKQQAIQSFLREVLIAEEAIKEVQKTKKGETVWINLGAGIYAGGLLESNTELKESIGGNVLIKSSNETVLQKIAKRRESSEKELAALQQEQQAIVRNLNNLSRMVQQAREQTEKQAKENSATKSLVS